MNALGDRGDGDEVVKLMHKSNMQSPKTYYLGCVFGYLAAIITTVVVMFVFDHGQPALLYLVPALLIATTLIALAKGEFKKLWEYTEENIVNDPEDGEEEESETDDKDKKPSPVKAKKVTSPSKTKPEKVD